MTVKRRKERDWRLNDYLNEWKKVREIGLFFMVLIEWLINDSRYMMRFLIGNKLKSSMENLCFGLQNFELCQEMDRRLVKKLNYNSNTWKIVNDRKFAKFLKKLKKCWSCWCLRWFLKSSFSRKYEDL